MRIMTCRRGQTVQIGEGITLKVVDVRDARGVALIGIDAPREVPIYRGELLPAAPQAPSQESRHGQA